MYDQDNTVYFILLFMEKHAVEGKQI